ncbi:iron complex transport system substrate-binding protein [Stackebrandtia endophytica]|uniref:Iron complex transport system substrate-binding protein n=1 Tax=Stackebrandtia endophytica TaxID=1496996 RepID=A0A543AYT8_9ACTN|nr:ABC transporter substrate-binding protein [Stackebrandtia endophytica]TQL77736.1 iron complex transport system substrate-binding protein [Stackebrandtia endophytica]
MTRTSRALLAGAVTVTLAGALAACGQSEPDQVDETVDSSYAAGDLVLPEKPERIVSLSGTTTEMLFAIGAGDQVEAVDMLSTYPADAPVTDLDAFTPNVESITGYEPDLVVLSHDQDDIIQKLTDVEVPVYYAPAAVTLDDTYQQIADLGALTGNGDAAETLNEEISGQIEQFVADLPERDEPLTGYYELDNTLFTLTSDTYAGSLLKLAGVENIADTADGAADAGGYPQLSAEFVLDSNPDLIFVSGDEAVGDVTGRDGWDSVTAVADGNVVALDPDVASRWGPRVVDLMEAITVAVSAV